MDLTKDIELYFRGMVEREEKMQLHSLLWTLDARFRLIPKADEINKAIQAVQGIEVSRSGNNIIFMPNVKRIDLITDDDIERALQAYNESLNELR